MTYIKSPWEGSWLDWTTKEAEAYVQGLYGPNSDSGQVDHIEIFVKFKSGREITMYSKDPYNVETSMEADYSHYKDISISLQPPLPPTPYSSRHVLTVKINMNTRAENTMTVENEA